MRAPPAPRPKREQTIALINVVFLMLIFFLIAGRIAPPVDPEVRLVDTKDLAGSEPPLALVIHADGRSSWQGAEVDPARFDLPDDEILRLLPDRALPADTLLEIAATLQGRGVKTLRVVTERGAK